MDTSALLRQLAILLSYLMVIVALAISASTTLKQMIRLYRFQAWMLTCVVVLTALGPEQTRLAVSLLALLPASLAVLVPPLLGRASLIRSRPGGVEDAGAPQARRTAATLWRQLWEAPSRAELTWLQHGSSRLGGGVSAGIDMLLIGTAVLAAYRLVGTVGEEAGGNGVVASLAVSIALLLQGLFTMSNKQDILAQVIGLLVMEHGLFLAAVRVAPLVLAPLLVFSLFCYLLVTLTILLWILPELRRASMSIEISDNRHLKG